MSEDRSPAMLVLIDTLFFLLISLGPFIAMLAPCFLALWLLGAPISFWPCMVMITSGAAVLLISFPDE